MLRKKRSNDGINQSQDRVNIRKVFYDAAQVGREKTLVLINIARKEARKGIL
jgi:hypothetical protein